MTLTLVGALPTATPSAAVDVTVRTGQVGATAGAYTDTKHRKTSHRSMNNLKVSTRFAAYLAFPGIALDAGEAVTASTLSVTVKNVSHASKGVLTVRPVLSGWSGAKVTYKSRPAVGPVIGTAKLKKSGTVAISLLPSASSYLAAGSGLRITRTGTKYGAKIVAKSARIDYTIGAASAATEPQAKPAPVVTSSTLSGHPVFAHYFPPYPISLDNVNGTSDYYATQYLLPSGESSKFASVGGLLRDRPLPRSPLSGDYQLADMKTEVSQAKQAGINGFAVDILSFNTADRNWQLTVKLLNAAAADGQFKVMLQPDMTSLGSVSTSTFAQAIASLAGYSSVYRDSNGAVVISPFYTEGKTPSWYSDMLKTLKSNYGVNAVLLPLFLDASNMSSYASLSIGFGNWGIRDPQSAATWTNWSAKAHSLGKLWMEPVAVQDVRPNQKVYTEAVNTNTLAATWNRAIGQNADLALMTTWNDYSESTSFAPSADHGWAFLDLNKYFVTKFQSGSASVSTEKLMIVHRIQRTDTAVTYSGTMSRVGATSPSNNVQIVTLLKQSADVTVTIGGNTYTYTASAGLYTKSYDLQPGYFTATASRSGATVLTVTTKDAVSFDTTSQQDLSYHAVVDR
ncbi:MAG: hypothetical protein LWW77_05745 [Propionibacteriales bacterium]|nr:hypothetical protein [Propionibacteriales bacterium]